jgi:hypothetical protein
MFRTCTWCRFDDVEPVRKNPGVDVRIKLLDFLWEDICRNGKLVYIFSLNS